ncbi:MAG: hypothetical protein AAGI63_18045, partial [Planctomycetota bacterium]
LSREDANTMVINHSAQPLSDADLEPQSERQILTRVLTNLVGVAGRRQDLPALYRYCEALVVVEPDAISSRRMRAQVRMMTERKKAALSDFDWLLENEVSTAAFHEAMALRNQLLKQMGAAADSKP